MLLTFSVVGSISLDFFRSSITCDEKETPRSEEISNSSNSYRIPIEFSTRVRSYNTCINNNKMDEKQIQKAHKCIDNLIDILIDILKYDYSIQVIR